MKITVDYREKASGLIDLFIREGISVEIKKVPYGDYIISNSITIERKTAKDLLISIIDGRLFSQLSNLKKYCINPILLIEGNPYKTDLNFDNMAIKGRPYLGPGHMVCSSYLFAVKRRHKRYFHDDRQAG